ncbi:hypothetical protein [Pedobacter sp.]|uniref:hypothetical protein n=1 Tax=Pedobacter sp. TaxID=1411316 RepID=UPI003C45315C
MKNSLKFSSLALTFCVTTTAIYAQEASVTGEKKSIVYSLGIDGGISVGSFRNISKGNFGGTIQADFPITQKLNATANAGYINFYNTNDYPSAKATSDLQYIPVKGGLKYFPLKNIYIQGEAGAGFVLNKSDVGFDNSVAFVYAPQIGTRFAIGSKSYLDAGVRYERSTEFKSASDESRLNYFGLRIAYAFSHK